VTSADPAALSPRGGTRALLAVATLFAANGLAVGVFGGTLPGQQARLDLSRIGLTGLLVVAALVAVASMNVSGAVADRRGARAPTLAAGAMVLVGSVVMGAAPTYLVALVGAGLFGLGNGAMDVGMNALGVSVEQARGRPVMSRLHACFSVGNFTGALLVVVLGRLLATDPAVRWSLWVGALLVGLLVVGIRPVVPDSPPRPAGTPQFSQASGTSRAGARVPMVAWLLAAMAVCFGLTEGTGIDWSSVHVAEVGHVSPTTGAWGLACVAGFMVVIRLAGDSVVERLGRALVVRVGAAVALCGYLLTAFTSHLWSILPGWSLVGLGVGLVAPQIYGLAGHVGGGRGLALVVSFGYGAFLVGPAVIGFIASQASLQRAMLVPVVTAVGLVVMGRWMPADPVEPVHANQ
jgi:MFS family permease